MINFFIGLVVGVILGGCVGLLTACVLFASRGKK